jgi:citrate synthase
MFSNKDEIAILKRLEKLAVHNDPINPDLYKKYDVKRGLRNANGTGVLVGLTRIGDVVGYELKDGEKIAIPGRLIYRGYNVEDLIKDAEQNKQFGFEQCAYLLLFGELPTKEKLDRFTSYLGECRILPENFTEDMIMKAPSKDIMNKMARGVLASYSYDDDPENKSVGNVIKQCIQLIARFSTLAAYGYQAKRRYYDNKSMFIHNPKADLSTAESFLRLIRSDKTYSRLEAETLDLALILHAEHGGGNNSSLTVHVVSSADTDTYSAIAAAVGSLKGSRHGGANIRVVEMMDELKANVKDWSSEKEVSDYLYKIARKEAYDKIDESEPFKIYGYDIDEEAIKIARENAELAGVEDYVEFNVANAVDFKSDEEYGFIITNPPYGERLEDADSVKMLYKELGYAFRKLKNWSYYLITSFEDFEKEFGQDAQRKRKLYNGMLKTNLYQYPGPKPPRKND